MLDALPPLRLLTLGRLDLESTTGQKFLAGRRKELVLLAYLARRAPRPARRAELATLLWENRDEARARHSLRQAMHNVTTVIGEGLEVGASEIRILPDVVELDAMAFERDVAAGRLGEAVERWAGEFLGETEDVGGESYRSWLEAEREGLRRRLSWALDRLTSEAQERGAWSNAIRWADRWAELFPYDETAHTRLTESLRFAGRMDEGAARHAAFADRLRRELGAEVSTAFVRLGATLRERNPRNDGRRPGAAALFTPDLVGRDADFSALVAAWGDAEAGESPVLLIEGEAGIGKTRLGQEFLRWLRGREPSPLVLKTTAYEDDAETPLSTLRRLLARLPAAPGLSGASDTALAELSLVTPAIRERFPRLPKAEGSESTLAGALNEVLRAVGAEVPIVFLLDDLPSADGNSQRLVRALAQDPPGSTLILLAGRSDLLQSSGIGTRLRQIPHLQHITLKPLSASDAEALLESMLAIDPESRRPLARRLHAESGGNPLYTIELVTALAEGGLLSLDPAGGWQLSPGFADCALPLPVRVRQATRERLARLDVGARTVLETAAVMGPRIEPRVLEEVSGLKPEAFSAALDELIARRLLREADTDPRQFEFAHEIVRRIAHELVSPGRRDALRLETARKARRALERPHPIVDVVILPFTVTGRDEHQVFGEGMLALLAAALDGTAGLRCADARLLLDFLATLPAQSSALERARRAAEHFSARWFVLGNLVAAAGKVRIAATVFEAESPPDTAVRLVVDGDETDLLELLDRTAAELLLRLTDGVAPGLLQLFQHRSASITALRAYLDGEAAFRQGEVEKAIDSFRAAIAHDPEFALAYYRLANALEWTHQPESPGWIAEALLGAVRLADHLPEQMRVLVRARYASMRGAGEEAVRLFRSIVSVAPDNVEAWYGLGCATFHYAQLWGSTISEAREPFEQVFAREPEHLAAAAYLASIAAVERRSADLQALSNHILQHEHRSVYFTFRLLIRIQLAYGLPDPALQEQVLEELRSAKDADMDALATFPLLAGDDLGAARRAMNVLTDLGRSPARMATGHSLLAGLELARGCWRAARSHLESTERVDGPLALEYLSLFAASPFLPLPTEEIRTLRERIRSWTPPSADEPPAAYFMSPHAPLHPLLLRYLDGALSVRLGDWEAAERAVDWLEQPERVTPIPDLGMGLAQRVRARVAAARGLPEAALSALDQRLPEIPWHWLVASGVLSGAHERLLRAEQLVLLGRWEEAKRWLAAATGLSPFDVVLLAPAALRRGEIAEAQGDRDAAVHHYRRFVELWRDCDEELRPLVDGVLERIAGLEGELGSAFDGPDADAYQVPPHR